MKNFKLCMLPVAILATSFANAGVVQNSTEQMADGIKTIFKTATHPAAISAEVGTLGYGGNIGWSVNEKTELIAGWTGARPDGNVKIDIDGDKDDDRLIIINKKKMMGKNFKNFKGNLDYKFKLHNPYLGVQLRPFGNALTVGTGVMFPKNSANVKLASEKAQFGFKVDGKEYTADGKMSVDVEVKNGNDIAPYLTLGFRPNSNKRWGVYGEVGASYMGKTKTNVKVDIDTNATITDNSSGSKVSDTKQLAKDLKDDIQKNISQKNLWYPVAKLGVTFRF